MTLPEIVIEQKPPRWPVALVIAGLVVALAPIAFLTFVNMIFWGFSGGEGGLYTVGFFVLPIAYILGIVAVIIFRARFVRVGLLVLAALLVLVIADAFVIVPLFVS